MNRFYVEIGTSDFDTLNDRYATSPTWEGLSIEPVPEYFKNLKRHDKNVYRNLAVVGSSCAPDTLPIYSIASETIKKHNLPSWLRGCGTLNKNNLTLLKYKEHIVEHEVKTISVEQLFKNIKCHVDLLKVDTEGCDYTIIKQVLLLGYRPTHIIFETCFMFDDELSKLYALLRKNHYNFIKRNGDSVQFSKPSVLLICDEDWSTGSIAKDLKCISDKWQVSILDWKNYTNQSELSAIFSEFDSIICFTLNAPTQWPILTNHSVVCCGEVEFNFSKNPYIPVANSYGAVSPTIYTKLTKFSSSPVFYTPASARLTRFNRIYPNHAQIKTIGFVGPTNLHSVKNFELFQEICQKSNTQALTTFKNYTYDTIQKFYHSIDILICTSDSEGGPLPIFEAIASGRPVFSTPVGLTREMSSIPKFNTADQCVDLIKVYSDSSNYINLGCSQYKEFQSSFSMETFLPYWEKFFQGSKYQTTVMI